MNYFVAEIKETHFLKLKLKKKLKLKNQHCGEMRSNKPPFNLYRILS